MVLAFLCALQNKLGAKGANRHVKENGNCNGDCMNCKVNHTDANEEVKDNG